MSLHREKIEQARRLVAETGLGAWLVFARETAAQPDPCLPLILDGGLTWQSALLFTPEAAVAIVGNYDAEPIKASGDWDNVVGYIQDCKPALVSELERLVPAGGQIGVNFSLDDDKSDGLTHGMWLLLNQHLAGTAYEGSLTSSERLTRALRGRKTAGELTRIKAAISETDLLFEEIGKYAQTGVSERAVYDHVQARMALHGLDYAWDRAGDPIVNSGPDSMIGHGVPSSDITVRPGHILHVDLGVKKEGYCSDIQRSWFVGREVPDEVEQALQAVNAAIDAGADKLRPGVKGWEVDAAARASIVASGYPEYLHALGHQVGQMAHDGGTVLAPRWPRYGDSPNGVVEEGEVYTLELGVLVEGRGYLGIEEMVVVRPGGHEFLTHRQLTVPCI